MPREAKGELRRLAEGWEARVTIQGKERLGLVLTFSLAQEAEAEQRCSLLAGLAKRLRKAGQVDDAPAAAVANHGAAVAVQHHAERLTIEAGARPDLAGRNHEGAG